MTLAEGIRRRGFRKWYERELLVGHSHLALLLFCALGLMMALEAAFRFRTLADQLIDGVAVLVCAGAGVWALRRYLFLLMRAESLANQADCPGCGAYGRLDLVDPQPHEIAPAEAAVPRDANRELPPYTPGQPAGVATFQRSARRPQRPDLVDRPRLPRLEHDASGANAAARPINVAVVRRVPPKADDHCSFVPNRRRSNRPRVVAKPR